MDIKYEDVYDEEKLKSKFVALFGNHQAQNFMNDGNLVDEIKSNSNEQKAAEKLLKKRFRKLKYHDRLWIFHNMVIQKCLIFSGIDPEKFGMIKFNKKQK